MAIEPEKCPDCERLKARSADDAANGLCPKWWAVRDPDSADDCLQFKTSPEYRKLCEDYQKTRA